jgi:ATPase subunit of ABC transporter with duplicated ATPase domains
VESLDPQVEAFGDSNDAAACRLRGRLALEPEALARWETLSPGERKRWQIGAALAEEPDALLLDEPTNHLDSGARRLLIGALRGFAGVGLVVSHDRELLDGLTTRTLRFADGGVRLWTGGYEQARLEWEAEEQGRREEHAAARAEQRSLERQLDKARRESEAAEANRSASRRMRSKNDSDARGILARTKADWASAGLSRRAGLTRARLEKAAERADSFELSKAPGRSVFADWARAPMPWLLEHEGPLLAGDRVLLTDARVRLGREDRVRLEGENGAGKSTLLNAMLAASRLPRQRILYLPQELSDPECAALLDSTRLLPPEERGRVLSFVAALGTDPGQLLSSAALSPGEARKLAIAHGLGRAAWLLVLDEPTNHLDLPSIERLEEALRDWPGALLLVSHDRSFAVGLTSIAWRIAKGALSVE